MLKHLESISSSVYERYLTLEKNIKSKSNSFYDAYLDLQESLVRHIISDVGLEINARLSCGELLRLEQVQSLFLDALGVDSHSYEKMKDYSRKVNSHKHSKEKNIELDTILSYVAIIYDVSADDLAIGKSAGCPVAFDGTSAFTAYQLGCGGTTGRTGISGTTGITYRVCFFRTVAMPTAGRIHLVGIFPITAMFITGKSAAAFPMGRISFPSGAAATFRRTIAGI